MTVEVPIAAHVVVLLAALARIGGFVSAIPGLTTSAVPMRIRASLILAVTIAMVPMLPQSYTQAAMQATTPGAQVLLVASELLLGLCAGFGAKLLLEITVFAGELIDRDVGYAMTAAFDPSIDASASVISSFFLRIFLVLFVTLDGHLALLRSAGASFATIVPGTFYVTDDVTEALIALFGRILRDGFCLSLPVFAIILLSNLVLALMARFGQEFEIMMISFPIRLGLGLFMIVAMMPVMVIIFTGLGSDIISWTDLLVR